MFAVTATSFDPPTRSSGLTLGEVPDTVVPEGWVRVHVRAASLNHHDLWSLKGVGLREDRLPMILGTDAAGVLDDGTPVVVHAVIGDPVAGGGDETLDPRRTLLSELHPGTFAETVAVPARNVVAKPDELHFEEAACLPTAWLTAYRMLATKSGLRVGDTVLVQGAGGGVATAAIQLADVMGFQVWATSRDEAKRARALELGAARGVRDRRAAARQGRRGDRDRRRGDLVALAALAAARRHGRGVGRDERAEPAGRPRPGVLPAAQRRRLDHGHARRARGAASSLLVDTGVRPTIDATFDLRDARAAFERLASGDVVGKLVLTNP